MASSRPRRAAAIRSYHVYADSGTEKEYAEGPSPSSRSSSRRQLLTRPAVMSSPIHSGRQRQKTTAMVPTSSSRNQPRGFVGGEILQGKRNRGSTKNYVVESDTDEEMDEAATGNQKVGVDDAQDASDADEDMEDASDEDLEVDAEGEDDEVTMTEAPPVSAPVSARVPTTPKIKISRHSGPPIGSTRITVRSDMKGLASRSSYPVAKPMGGKVQEVDDEDEDEDEEDEEIDEDEDEDGDQEEEDDGEEDLSGSAESEQEFTLAGPADVTVVDDDAEGEEDEEEDEKLANQTREVGGVAIIGEDEDAEGEVDVDMGVPTLADDDSDADGWAPNLTKMTKRQRAKFEPAPQQHMKLSDEVQAKKVFTAEELSMRRLEMARRRRNLSDKRIEEVKMDTINKLLKKQPPRGKGRVAVTSENAGAHTAGPAGTSVIGADEVLGTREAAKKPPDGIFVRWLSSRVGNRIGVPIELVTSPAFVGLGLKTGNGA